MPDREKVMRGLEFRLDCFALGCDAKCPYIKEPGCTRVLLQDALVLLKEQEPRVIPLSELLSYPEIWEFNTPPYLCIEEIDASRMWWRTWRDIRGSITCVSTMGYNNYGTEWRVWNLQPTEEQRKAVPWDA